MKDFQMLESSRTSDETSTYSQRIDLKNCSPFVEEDENEPLNSDELYAYGVKQRKNRQILNRIISGALRARRDKQHPRKKLMKKSVASDEFSPSSINEFRSPDFKLAFPKIVEEEEQADVENPIFPEFQGNFLSRTSTVNIPKYEKKSLIAKDNELATSEIGLLKHHKGTVSEIGPLLSTNQCLDDIKTSELASLQDSQFMNQTYVIENDINMFEADDVEVVVNRVLFTDDEEVQREMSLYDVDGINYCTPAKDNYIHVPNEYTADRTNNMQRSNSESDLATIAVPHECSIQNDCLMGWKAEGDDSNSLKLTDLWNAAMEVLKSIHVYEGSKDEGNIGDTDEETTECVKRALKKHHLNDSVIDQVANDVALTLRRTNKAHASELGVKSNLTNSNGLDISMNIDCSEIETNIIFEPSASIGAEETPTTAGTGLSAGDDISSGAGDVLNVSDIFDFDVLQMLEKANADRVDLDSHEKRTTISRCNSENEKPRDSAIFDPFSSFDSGIVSSRMKYATAGIGEDDSSNSPNKSLSMSRCNTVNAVCPNTGKEGQSSKEDIKNNALFDPFASFDSSGSEGGVDSNQKIPEDVEEEEEDAANECMIFSNFSLFQDTLGLKETIGGASDKASEDDIGVLPYSCLSADLGEELNSPVRIEPSTNSSTNASEELLKAIVAEFAEMTEENKTFADFSSDCSVAVKDVPKSELITKPKPFSMEYTPVQSKLDYRDDDPTPHFKNTGRNTNPELDDDSFTQSFPSPHWTQILDESVQTTTPSVGAEREEIVKFDKAKKPSLTFNQLPTLLTDANDLLESLKQLAVEKKTEENQSNKNKYGSDKNIDSILDHMRNECVQNLELISMEMNSEKNKASTGMSSEMIHKENENLNPNIPTAEESESDRVKKIAPDAPTANTKKAIQYVRSRKSRKTTESRRRYPKPSIESRRTYPKLTIESRRQVEREISRPRLLSQRIAELQENFNQ